MNKQIQIQITLTNKPNKKQNNKISSIPSNNILHNHLIYIFYQNIYKHKSIHSLSKNIISPNLTNNSSPTYTPSINKIITISLPSIPIINSSKLSKNNFKLNNNQNNKLFNLQLQTYYLKITLTHNNHNNIFHYLHKNHRAPLNNYILPNKFTNK